MKRILFVGMVNSPHFARWISQFEGRDYDIHIFPVYFAPPHELLKNVTVHIPWKLLRPRQFLRKLLTDRAQHQGEDFGPGDQLVRSLRFKSVWPIPIIAPFDSKLAHIGGSKLGESGQRSPLMYGPRTLAKVIRTIKPDLIHSMEFQHAGYLVLEAKKYFRRSKFPRWLATNWGSDIYFFRSFADHRLQITRLLSEIDYYSCECERDITIARDLGLTAQVMPVVPNSGGFNISKIKITRSAVKVSDRKLIMVKGYQSFAGRALHALEAIAKCAYEIQDYRVIVFAASPEVRERATEIRDFYGINITILEQTTHERILRYYANARIYLGVSISDGISTSMIEAMAMGAFPMQTNTACCSEWIEDGVTGFELEHDDVEAVASKLRIALSNDELVDVASELNWEIVKARLDEKRIKSIAAGMYETILNDVK